MTKQTANSGEGEQTMNEELTLDSFRPLIEADEERRRAAANFRNAENRARQRQGSA